MATALSGARRLKPEARTRLAQGIGDAAAIIEAKGWCKGGLEDRRSRVCMMGAVRDRLIGEPTKQKMRAYAIINDALGADMTIWNDEQNTPAPVVAKLREIASLVGPWQERPFCEHGRPRCSGCGAATACWGDEGCNWQYPGAPHARDCPERRRPEVER